jgi:hypothetical protein
MEPEFAFFLYLGAIVCLVLAAMGDGWQYGRRSRRQLAPAVMLLPLGIALALVPTLWNAAEAAF